MKSKKSFFIAILTGLFLVSSFTGCSTGSVNTVSGNQDRSWYNEVKTDPVLAKYIQVTNVVKGQAQGGFMKVQVQLQNTSTEPQAFYYRFRWKDANGMFLTSLPATWTYKELQGKAMGEVSEISRYPEATAYVMDVKKNKK